MRYDVQETYSAKDQQLIIHITEDKTRTHNDIENNTTIFIPNVEGIEIKSILICMH